ncbi:hypothetical protein [Bacillus sp. ISL-37]|uniref:hypothetical protein n=1 Tax=Bacillus sp. ISL-37 TaxID=2819123 RepID=UPI001BE843A5|nr:hypothetical protein [Bacillus sp. ISL-37]MBT2685261.1 hypothetical protein [Bacillus sp. ISL-37]
MLPLLKTFFVDGAENPYSKISSVSIAQSVKGKPLHCPKWQKARKKGKRKAVALPQMAEGKEKG